MRLGRKEFKRLDEINYQGSKISTNIRGNRTKDMEEKPVLKHGDAATYGKEPK